MALNVGDIFQSFAECENALKKYGEEHFTVFVKANCSRLSADHPDCCRLQYNFMKYECKQGSKRKTKSQGTRPNQRTVKQGCEAFIRVVKDKDGERTFLKIKSLNLSHNNHPVDKKTVSLYPENRKANVTETVKALVAAKTPKKELQQYIAESQGVTMLPMDIYNLTRRLEVPDTTDSKGVEDMLKLIRDGGGYTKFDVNERGEFEYLFYVTADMKHDLSRFCDVLVMDTTYNVNCYLYPLVNVLCVDAEGSGRPVLHGFVRNESRHTVMSCLSFLKSVMSDDVCGPSVFFVDKDFSEVATVRDTFPDSLVKLCSFHAATAVKRALHDQGFSSQEVEVYLAYFKQQRDTWSQQRYQDICDIIRRDAPDRIVQYFQTNWWDICDVWATHIQLDLQTLHETTTKHVESYDSKIKQTLHPQIRLTDCIKTLLDYDADLVRTKDLRSHLHNITHHYNVKHNDPTLECIMNSLTSFASKLVSEQYQLTKRITYTHTHIPGTSQSCGNFEVTIETLKRNSYTTSVSDCNCAFFSKFHLPCRHIFYLRHFFGHPLCTFDMLSGSRFLKARQIVRDDRPNVAHTTDIVCNRRMTSTQEGRYRVVSALTGRLNAVFQVMGEVQFGHRLEQLERFLQLVNADKGFSIVDMTSTASQTVKLPGNDRTETAPASDNDRKETAPSSSAVTDNDSFSLVRLLKVKTHGQPRNERNKRRRIDPTADILIDRQPTNDTTVSLTQDIPPSADITDNLTDRETAAASDNVCAVPDKDVCHSCGKEELEQNLCQDGVTDWVMCKECPRWFHRYCLGPRVRVQMFVCCFCLPNVVMRMQGTLDDHMHNLTVLLE